MCDCWCIGCDEWERVVFNVELMCIGNGDVVMNEMGDCVEMVVCVCVFCGFYLEDKMRILKG